MSVNYSVDMKMVSKILSLAFIVAGLSFVAGDVNAANHNCKSRVLKAQNHIQEDGKGYVKAIKTDKKTVDCVKTINEKRRAKYESIAKKDKIPVSEVEKIAAEKLK